MPSRLAQALPFAQTERGTLPIALLAIVYAVGIVGALLPIHPDFMRLTPLNLLFSFAMLMAAHEDFSRRFWAVAALCFGTGLGVEILGVQTGAIFGAYHYEQVLGPKIGGAPWLIGLNWLMLIYATGVSANYLRLPRWGRATVAAAAMTALDVLIEPVAIRYDFWEWDSPSIPLQNYLAWFLISLALLLPFHYLLPAYKNRVAPALLLLQALFFFALGMA